MILTWMLLCLAAVAAFPKASHRVHTTPQTGSNITTPPTGQTRPVPVPRRPLLFKKNSKRRRPSAGLGATTQVTNGHRVKPWGKGHRHVNVRPPPPVISAQPWIIPVHGLHHLPTHRIIVLTGNNVISLHPKDSSSEGKITQLLLTSGNSGISLQSSGCSLEHGCKEKSLPKLDPPPKPGVGLEVPGIEIDEELSIEAVLTDILKAVTGGVLTGIGKGNDFGTELLTSPILLGKVIEDSSKSEAKELETILNLSEHVGAEEATSDTGKHFDTIEVHKDVQVEPEETTKKHFLNSTVQTEKVKAGVNIDKDFVEEVLETTEHLKEGKPENLGVVFVDEILLLDKLLDR